MNIYFSILILNLDENINNANYFSDWLKNPYKLSHIKVLLLVDYWTQNGILTFEYIAAEILNLVFESRSFDEILAFVCLIHSEIALIIMGKLLLLYPAGKLDREKNHKFMEILTACCTHLTESIKNEKYFSSAVSFIENFSNIIFNQLKIVLTENSNVPECIDM